VRNVFGWSLPPGCTQRMIDEAAGADQPCAVCCMDVADCCCPECSVCGEQGNPRCYEQSTKGDGFTVGSGHGLKLNKEQVVSRVNAYIHQLQLRIEDEQQFLGYLEVTEQTEWDIKETRDPFA
jgi:hypothetical protein